MRSASKSMPWALLGCLVLVLTAAGCKRAVRPEMGGDRTVEAGVPVTFGSPEGDAAIAWEFGDGQKATGAGVTHAFPRAGSFTVRALHEGEEVGRAVLTVVPRPLLRAIPSDAQVAFYLPRLRGNVEPLLTFAEQLVGPENARNALEQAPFGSLVLESLREGAGPGVVDPEEGMGFFMVPGFEGVVGLLGVTEPQAALDAAVREFESAGDPVQREADGLVRVQPPQGTPVFLFVDRGYLYLAMPDDLPTEATTQAEGVPPPTAPPSGSRDVAVVRRMVTGATGPGLSEAPLIQELRAKVAEGNLYLFTRPDEAQAQVGLRGVYASFAAKGERAELDGFVSTDKPLFGGKRGPDSALLDQAPQGPVAAALFSVPPEELATLVFGAPGSERRGQAVARMKEQGLDAEALLGALRGDVALLAYFDAPAFFRNFIVNKRPDVRGTLLVDAGLTRAEPVLQVLSHWMERSGSQRVETRKEGTTTRFRTRFMEQPVLLSVTPERATLQVGEPLEARPRADVGAALTQRFGAGAFEQGHVSVMADLGRLREELDAPKDVPGVPQGQLAAAQAFSGALLDQLTPLEHAFLDFTPAEGGGRIHGRLVLRPD
jgi:hypothetical protein